MKKVITDQKPIKKIRPALHDETREQQLIALAYDAAEEHLRTGKATSQEICYFLKLGSSKEKIERDILDKQAELITAKTEALQSSKKMDEIYAEALAALKEYKGESPDEK